MLGLGLGITSPRGGGGAPWALEGSALDLDFAGGRYAQAARAKSFSELFTFSRASVGMAQKLDGSWETFASGVPRITDKGILIEEARTNLIPNNTMVGAATGVLGAGGSSPTGWRSPAGAEIVGFGVVQGLNYIDIRFAGVAANTNPVVLYPEPVPAAATIGQVFTSQVWIALVGGVWGAPGNLTDMLVLRHGGEAGPTSFVPTATLERIINTRTLAATDPSMAIRWNYVSAGVAYDFTLRIAMPQREFAAFATSPIPTSGSAVTRATELLNLSIANSEPFYDAAGSAYAEIDLPSASHAFGRVFDVATRFLYTDSGNNFMVYTRDSVNRNSQTPIIRNAVFKVACKWGATEHKIVTEGTTLVASSSTNTVSASAAHIGNRATGDRALCGYIKRLAVYPDELADATLTAMVAPPFV